MSARIMNSRGKHEAHIRTNDAERSIVIPPKASGYGSSANGGELLFLALATCYCNDIYREAAQRHIVVRSVEVEVSGDFDGVPGHPGTNITYSATVEAEASEADIQALMQHTDTVAEIQNTLRQGVGVVLAETKARPVT
ncbi:MAG: OsmC family protein [Anaerolineae bacterium]|nr:OsmC family protein [Anaerolineae bacterium]